MLKATVLSVVFVSALVSVALAFEGVTENLPRLEALDGYGSEVFDSFTFVQIGDPQIGYKSTWPAARRLRRLAVEIEATDAAFGIVVGDLTQDRTSHQKWLLRRSLASFSIPLAFVPGNHDVVDLPTLVEYRKGFGPDYYTFVFNGCGFIGLNSEILQEDLSATETHAQWAWFEAELEKLQSQRLRHLFLFLHTPPFTSEGRENRQNPLIQKIRAANIQHVLAGHLHTSREIGASDSAFTVYTVAGTANTLDDRGYGYRTFHVSPDGVRQRYIAFDRPPDLWLVRHGWSPRILDPSLRHWLLTTVFLLTAWLTIHVHRIRNAKAGSFWILLGMAYIFLAANMQLDFDEILGAIGRTFLRTMQVYGKRRVIQSLVLASGVLMVIPIAFFGWRHLHGVGRWGLIALLGFSIPLISFLLHTLSLHQTEQLLYLWGRTRLYLVEAAGAALTCWAAWAYRGTARKM